MRLIKRLIELAFVIFVISLFMKNKDVVMNISYFGLSEPITVQFWELVTFCVALGITIAALGDFITQLKWVKERRRMVKTDREHQSTVDSLNEKIESLEAENQRLTSDVEKKSKEIEKLKPIDAAPTPAVDAAPVPSDKEDKSEESESQETKSSESSLFSPKS
jgi:predicted RNase H-like nuclease (RuvC/YqgF family)